MGRPFRQTRHTAAYLLVKLFLSCALLLPRTAGLLLFSLLGQVIGLFLIPYRKEIRKNLDTIYGSSLSKAEKEKILQGIFINLGKTLFDAIKVPSLPKEKFNAIVQFDSSAVAKSLADHEKGAITLGGHLSCFELQSQAYAYHDLPIIVIGAKLFDPRIDQLVENLRKRNDTCYLTRDGSGRKLFKELKNNKIFGALIDQDATHDGVFSHFLGNLAFTPTGPIRMALKFKIPLFFQTIERQRDNSYIIKVEGPIEIPQTGDDTHNLLLLAEQYNSFISEQILRCPDQWVWMHRRWKRKREDLPEIPSITDYRSQ